MSYVTMAVTYANGTVLRAQGFIDAESWESQDNKITLTLIPQDNRWEVFSGSGDTSGSIRKIVINGVTYRVLGDANFSLVPAEYKNEGVATSGGNMRRMTKQVRTMSSVTIGATMAEVEQLRAVAES